MTCTCGDVDDEHRYGNGHYHECEIEDCPCIMFERDPEADDD